MIALARKAFSGGEPARAEELCRAVLAAKADQFDALMLLGILAAQGGRPEEAAGLLRRACEARPFSAVAHNNLANVLKDLGRHDEALASYDSAIAQAPGDAEIHFNRANALAGLGRLADAVAGYDRAVSLRPDYAAAHMNRGNALRSLRQPEAAVASHRRAIAADPGFAGAHLNLGNALQDLGRFDEAIASYDRALALRPDFAEAYSNRGNALQGLTRFGEAIACYDRAIALQPGHADAHSNRGNVLKEMMRLDEALASYDRAIALAPGLAEARFNKSLTLLLAGRFAEGWPLYEYRWQSWERHDSQRRRRRPPWRGELPVAGRTMLLHAEQGFGDTIQFCRYAPLVAALGARVVLDVQPSLTKLLRSLDGVAAVNPRGVRLPPFDLHCPLMSLPLAFRTEPGTIPGSTPYLRSDPRKVEQWRARLGPRTARRVGIAWAGTGTDLLSRKRNMSFAQFCRMLPRGVDVVSLQKDVSSADRADLRTHPGIRFFGDEISDFSDTAALCELMDLVISAGMNVAHLAGALGRPVWVLLPWVPDWRWLLNRADSPWYPTARLYRQEQLGAWEGVIERVRADLAALAAGGALQ